MTATEPRPAATVIVARQARDDVEVLALRRGPATRFGPGFVVFPGGTIDPADAELGKRWFGTETEAARAAAVRELAEETGFIATSDGIRAQTAREEPVAAISESPPSPLDV